MKNAIYKNVKIFTGIDVHKKSWELRSVSKDVVLKRLHMTNPTAEKVVKHLTSEYPGADHTCVYEAGFSGFWLQEELTLNKIKTLVVHPGDVPTTDKEKRNKTDVVDCKKLAMGLRSGQLTGIYIPSKVQQHDRSLVRQRYQFASDERRMKNRIKSHLNFYGMKVEEELETGHWSKNYLNSLLRLSASNKDEVLKVYLEKLVDERKYALSSVRKLRALSKTEKYIKEVELLRSIPGVGLLTTMVYLTEIGKDTSRFKSDDKYISYIGLVPNVKASAEKKYTGGLNKRGNKRLRTALILSAWMSIRHSGVMLQEYQKHKSSGKVSNKAIVRIARKLSLIIKAVLRDGVKYNEAKILKTQNVR